GGGGGGGGAALVFVSVQVTVAPASSTTEPSPRQPLMPVRLYPETESSLTLYVPGISPEYVVPVPDPAAGLPGSSRPAAVTWIEKSPGPFVPPPLLLFTTFFTISVASFVFVKVQVTFSDNVRLPSAIDVPV